MYPKVNKDIDRHSIIYHIYDYDKIQKKLLDKEKTPISYV